MDCSIILKIIQALVDDSETFQAASKRARTSGVVHILVAGKVFRMAP